MNRAEMLGERRIRELSRWIDTSPANRSRDREAATWGRLAKVAEEAGEVISAYIDVTGQNPRKGFAGSMGEVEKELYDVALTALCAVAHLRGNHEEAEVMFGLYDHIDRTHARAGLKP